MTHTFQRMPPVTSLFTTRRPRHDTPTGAFRGVGAGSRAEPFVLDRRRVLFFAAYNERRGAVEAYFDARLFGFPRLETDAAFRPRLSLSHSNAPFQRPKTD